MTDAGAVDFYLSHPLFDTHFHGLHMERRGMDTLGLLGKAMREGLMGAVEVAVDELDFPQRLSWCDQISGLRLSAGIHPSALGEEKTQGWDERFALVCGQISHPSVVAVGETGLDFHRKVSSPDRQKTALAEHLRLAAEQNLPVIIHNRMADAEVLRLIQESQCRLGVFHCFSSDWETAGRALDLGFFVSFAGNLTYKNSHSIRQAAVKTPIDRLLLETDSPYLSPQAVRGRVNHPGHIGLTLEVLADIRGEDIAELANRIADNSTALFGGKTG